MLRRGQIPFRAMSLIRGTRRFDLTAKQLAHAEQAKGHVILTQGMDILRCEQSFRPLTSGEGTSQYAQLSGSIGLKSLQQPQVTATPPTCVAGLVCRATRRTG